jgi:hypothetical protein
MCDYYRAQADLRSAPDLNALGVFIFQVDIIPYENVLPDFHPAQPMQSRAHRSGTGQNAGQ